MANQTTISNRKLEALAHLLKFIDTKRLSKGLRNLLVVYLFHEYESLPRDFKDLMEDLNFLFRFLDELETPDK